VQVYIASRTAKACDETATRLTRAGPGTCVSIPADLAKYEECERVVREIEGKEKGGLR
jgi:short-subunit dehydrogenase